MLKKRNFFWTKKENKNHLYKWFSNNKLLIDKKLIGYDKEFIKELSNFKGIKRDFVNVLNKKEKRIKKDNYIISRIKKPNVNKLNGYNTEYSYFFILKTKNGLKKYYIKEADYVKNNFRNFFYEFYILNELKKKGYDVIIPKFVKTDFKKDYSFIVLEYTNLIDINTAQDRKIISNRFVRELHNYLKFIEQDMSKNLNLKLKDININNCFIDPKTKKIIMYDPFSKSSIDMLKKSINENI